ncbi:MAG: efflux RND transporter permease subunit [Pseudohongiellaceae bacterium]
MEALGRLGARRPIAVTVIAVVLTLLGIISWRSLPLDLFPDLQSPTVLVSVSAGDRPALEMERLYGQRIEQLLFTVSGIRSIDQVARAGRLVTRVTFDWNTDVDLALVEVNRSVASIEADADVDEVQVRRFDPRQLPILVLGIVPESSAAAAPDLSALRTIARRQIAPGLEQLPGVAEARISGGRVTELQVRIDRTRMLAYGLTIAQVRQQISDANTDVTAGTLEDGSRLLLVRGQSRFVSADDVRNVVLRYVDAGVGQSTAIRVADIAEIVLDDADISSLVRVNGVEGVGVFVYKEAGANTVTVARTVREAVGDAGLGGDLPGIAITTVSDESALVEDAISGVQSAALIGIALAIGVLILYLRSPGPVVIVAVAVPVSLLATVLAMGAAGHSLNLMTLGGLALGAGMLVDNAIVVIESIFRRRSEGDSPAEAAAKGTGVVGAAIVASTLTTCVVFLPVLFLQGMAAKLVAGIAFTVVVSLLASLLVAIFLIPALSMWLLPRLGTADVDPGSARVERMVLSLLRRPLTVVAITCVLCATAIVLVWRLGSELLPPSDPRQFGLRVTGPAGQSVESTAATVAGLEGIVGQAAGDHLAAMLAEVGRLEDDGRVIRERRSEENTAEMQVRLSGGGPSASTVVEAAVPAISLLYGVDVDWQLATSALSQALGTAAAPVTVEVTGRSLDDIRYGTQVLQQQLITTAPLWNVRTSFEGAAPELHLRLKRNVADAYGVDLPQVSAVLEAVLDGLPVTTLSIGDEERDIIITLPAVAAEQLTDVVFQSANGQILTVGDVVTVETIPGAREIYRRDQRRIGQVTALVRPEFTNPEARLAAEQAIQNTTLPGGITARLAGEELERQQTVNELRWAAILAALLVFMVLAGSFESLLQPFTVLSVIPITVIGVAVALVPQGEPLGIMAMLGFIVLVGVAVNDAILFAQMARGLILEGMERRSALARAAALRLRPIVMTTATTVLALIPLALGGGEGAELRSPLAWTVIGGITASTFASLTVVPCIYYLLDRLGQRFRRQVAPFPRVPAVPVEQAGR